jgi:hypothetical protein
MVSRLYCFTGRIGSPGDFQDRGWLWSFGGIAAVSGFNAVGIAAVHWVFVSSGQPATFPCVDREKIDAPCVLPSRRKTRNRELASVCRPRNPCPSIRDQPFRSTPRRNNVDTRGRSELLIETGVPRRPAAECDSLAIQ